MENLNNINHLRLLNSNCLIEIEGIVNTEQTGETYIVNEKTESGIIIGGEVATYNKADHAIRYGKIIRMPEQINWDKARWKTDVFPNPGDEVWFDYLDAKNSEMVKYNGKIHIILSYFSLIVARSPLGDIKLLNGYLLAQKTPIKKESDLQITQQYYDDIYDIKMAGKPNIRYKPERDKYGSIVREHIDDKSITEGMTVMTKAGGYPILEDKLHMKFSKETYHYMQRRDIIAKVEEI